MTALAWANSDRGSVGIMTLRRDFLKAAAGVGALGAEERPGAGSATDGLAVAREMVRRGDLGVVHFCRIAHRGLRDAASYVLDRADCMIEIEPGTEGAAFLGSRATLVVHGWDWRVFGQAATAEKKKVKSQK